MPLSFKLGWVNASWTLHVSAHGTKRVDIPPTPIREPEVLLISSSSPAKIEFRRGNKIESNPTSTVWMPAGDTLCLSVTRDEPIALWITNQSHGADFYVSLVEQK